MSNDATPPQKFIDMAPAVIAAIVSAAASTAGTAANVVSNERSRNKNLQFWNLQNQYNAPASTVSRLKAAGLNPNLIYGNGQAITPASEISQAQPLDYTKGFQNLGNSAHLGLSDYLMVRNSDAQVKNLEANTGLTNAKAVTEGAIQQSYALQNYSQQVSNYFQKERERLGIENLKLGNSHLGLQNQNMKLQNELAGYQSQIQKATVEAQIDSMMTLALQRKADFINALQQFKALQAQTGMYNAQASSAYATAKSLNTDTDWRKQHYEKGINPNDRYGNWYYFLDHVSEPRSNPGFFGSNTLTWRKRHMPHGGSR